MPPVFCSTAPNRNWRPLPTWKTLKNQILNKLGLDTTQQEQDTNYLNGLQGLLKTKDGQQLNLNNIGSTPLAEKVKTKACDLVLQQGLNFLS